MLNFAPENRNESSIPMQKNNLFLRSLLLLAASLAAFSGAWAQNSAPTCSPKAVFTYTEIDSEGHSEEKTEELESYSGSAPVVAQFTANPSGLDGEDGTSLYTARYEWRIYDQQTPDVTIVHRFDEDIDYRFEHSGSFVVELKATFVQGNDTVYYPQEGETGGRFTVSISESQLQMPNAFSPNGDGWNDTYKAKTTHQSIVSFKATIFNRWGKKLYSWDDVNGEWDGKVNGKVVPDGVYFVNVVAKGADGRVYHIRKDVNVLTRLVTDQGDATGGDE